MKKRIRSLTSWLAKLTPREQKLIWAALFVLLTVLLWTQLFEPLLNEFHKLNYSIPQRQRQIQELETSIQRVEITRQKIAEIIASTQQAQGKPSGATEMQDIIAKLKISDNLGDMLALDSKPFRDVSSVPLDVRLNNVSPEQLLSLLRELDRSWPRVSIQGLSLRRNQGAKENFDISLRISFLRPKA
jgi:type II secretory pathway component PulM